MAQADDIAATKDNSEPGRSWQIVCGVRLIVTGIQTVLMPWLAALATARVLVWLLMANRGGTERDDVISGAAVL